jgi:hypothetical protein
MRAHGRWLDEERLPTKSLFSVMQSPSWNPLEGFGRKNPVN